MNGRTPWLVNGGDPNHFTKWDPILKVPQLWNTPPEIKAFLGGLLRDNDGLHNPLDSH